jgi:2-polyprenyl-3-methyl-5-hydroxy-6-metoxy-1,4-benzoquinol methylase
MKLGPLVRRMFGPYERRISEAYRAIYIDIDAQVQQFRQWQPEAKNILEVGCGEGSVTQRLRAAYPDSHITAIDITSRLGRLYRGPQENVRFVRCSVQEIAAAHPAAFDFVVLCDVLHHVPVQMRQDLLDAIRMTIAPGGAFIFKDWQINRAPIHWLCYASDRWLTGDRIHYMTREEMRERLTRSFGGSALVAEARIAPWWNNIATLLRP